MDMQEPTVQVGFGIDFNQNGVVSIKSRFTTLKGKNFVWKVLEWNGCHNVVHYGTNAVLMMMFKRAAFKRVGKASTVLQEGSSDGLVTALDGVVDGWRNEWWEKVDSGRNEWKDVRKEDGGPWKDADMVRCQLLQSSRFEKSRGMCMKCGNANHMGMIYYSCSMTLGGVESDKSN